MRSNPSWTTREAALVRLMLADGSSYAEIAEAIGRSPQGVKNYIYKHPKQFAGLYKRYKQTEADASPKRRPGPHSCQPCWHCVHAVPDPETGAGCEWSRRFQPVPGWDAEEIRPPESYCYKLREPWYKIRQCTQFLEG